MFGHPQTPLKARVLEEVDGGGAFWKKWGSNLLSLNMLRVELLNGAIEVL